ncbi:multicopper oxidase-domain-containing protein [Podospora appendiculata]|uniref:Multicopper oxidase-domain-containing protein n=1 Tax=Podospora appendiculata TaxID=314037 RepID=A0AAE0X942_9PEZI|nr:multicopper oxidase-domain-containing protein [Podospora appendiculata]
MKLESVWTGIVQIFHVLTFSTTGDGDVSQVPLNPHGDSGRIYRPTIPIIETATGKVHDGDDYLIQDDSSSQVYHSNDVKIIPHRTGGKEFSAIYGDTPVVGTPKNPQDGAEGGLVCKYEDMQGWEPCYGPENRSCWLKNGELVIDINTDYENPDLFNLEVSEQPISPDGTTMEHGKVFNRRYPGPWIEACWGDWIEITVKNNLRWNGTSVHWHGIRQFESFQHDGVNGITECPIAPGDSFTYKFRALQYGSAWYHSHYSLQYGDGLLGPMTIYGPSTSNFDSDQAFRPILLTDWNHRSVFEDWPLMLQSGAAPEMTNILINGTGQFGWGPKPKKYTLWLDDKKAHMLILVNTAVDTTFVFSIDHHQLEVIEMDFVPIKPYNTTNIKIGIGQRYHVIIHGLHNPYAAERYGNYWMRAEPARKCSKFAFGPDQQMGIIRYNRAYQNVTNPPDPLSEPPLFDINCADEPYDKLIPWRPWQVGNPVNIDPTHLNHSTLPNNTKYIFDVGMTKSGGPGSNTPYIPDDQQYTRWDMHIAPFRVNFSDPTLLALDRLPELINKPHLDVITLPNTNEDQWIWMVITAPGKVPTNGGRIFFPAAHPMHLHGHDFALLKQSNVSWYPDEDINYPGDREYFTADKLNCENPRLNCTNPPRRDVVLLPASGYVIIAFKADNPGAWIIHCHIAFHASSGLGMQIIENKDKIPDIMAKDKAVIEDACTKWKAWHGNSANHWDFHHPSHFQDDSGV